MLLHSIFNNKIPVNSEHLTKLTLISLENWMLIKITGKDAIQFIHNQFTCDIKNLNKNQYRFSAHCNPQGKMIANMYVFYHNEQEISYITPKNTSEKQILFMKKYSKFSDIKIISDHNASIIGITGSYAKNYLEKIFSIIPNQKKTIIHYENVTIMYFSLPIERFLLIVTNTSLLIDLLNKTKFSDTKFYSHQQWTALDIEAGYPYIDVETSELFVPQSANIDLLNGVSFNKGCFLGQEIIARIQYRKLNKKKLYHLFSNINYYQNTALLPKSGNQIELFIKNQYWKNVGTILQSCEIHKQTIWIQAILNKSISDINNLKLRTIVNSETIYYLKIQYK